MCHAFYTKLPTWFACSDPILHPACVFCFTLCVTLCVTLRLTLCLTLCDPACDPVCVPAPDIVCNPACDLCLTLCLTLHATLPVAQVTRCAAAWRHLCGRSCCWEVRCSRRFWGRCSGRRNWQRCGRSKGESVEGCGVEECGNIAVTRGMCFCVGHLTPYILRRAWEQHRTLLLTGGGCYKVCLQGSVQRMFTRHSPEGIQPPSPFLPALMASACAPGLPYPPCLPVYGLQACLRFGMANTSLALLTCLGTYVPAPPLPIC